MGYRVGSVSYVRGVSLHITPFGMKRLIEHNSEQEVTVHGKTSTIELMYDIFGRLAEPSVPEAETADLKPSLWPSELFNLDQACGNRTGCVGPRGLAEMVLQQARVGVREEGRALPGLRAALRIQRQHLSALPPACYRRLQLADTR